MLGLGLAIGEIAARPARGGAAALPTIALSAGVTRAEGNSGITQFTYTVSRSRSIGAVSVAWSFEAGGATAADFAGGVLPAGGTLTLADGVASASVSIGVAGDTAIEPDETFTVRIAVPAGYAAGGATSATGTILNDDSPAAPGIAATAFTLAPTVAYHPHSQAGAATKDGQRITACPDRQGLAALSGLSAAGATVGPTEMTDALGRKFWRFDGANYALISNALAGLSARGLTVMMVARRHLTQPCQYFSPRYSAYTDDTTNTTFSGGSSLRAVGSAGAAPILYGGAIPATGDAANAYKMVPGCQLQVIGLASRTTANPGGGGQRLYINTDVATIAQTSNTFTSNAGGVICGTPAAGNAVSAGSASPSATNNALDLYEFALWKGELTDAQADAAAAALVANWSIPALTRQLWLDGDSITNAIDTALPTVPGTAGNMGMILSEPGSDWVPASTRVLNTGSSGNQTSHLATKKNASPSLANLNYPGGAANNVVAIQIGRNDVAESSGKKNSAMLYADVVALINNATAGSEGYLQRGRRVVVVGNIAGPGTAVSTNLGPSTENTIQKRLEGLRDLIADTAAHAPRAQFLADCQAGGGQAYAGLVDVLHLYDVTAGGATRFRTVADAGNTGAGAYDSDNTHLRLAGQQLMVSGGDTPHHGYGAIL